MQVELLAEERKFRENFPSMENALPTGLQTAEGFLSFQEIHERFSATSYGQTLAKNIRYRFFKPPEVSNSEWEDLLGPDVNNLEHHWVVYRTMRAFLRRSEGFSWEDQEILLLTGETHDWAEAIMTDIPYGQKTNGEEDLELRLIPQIAEECFGDVLRQPIRQTIEQVLQWKPNLRKTGEGPKLSHAFEAVEQMGFLGTAGRAWKEAQRRKGISDFLRGNMQWLGIEVHAGHSPILLRYAEMYPAVRRYLVATRHRMSDILHGGTPSTPHPNLTQEEVSAMLSALPAQREAWEEWLKAVAISRTA